MRKAMNNETGKEHIPDYFGLNIFIGSNNKHKALQCLSHSYNHSYTLNNCVRVVSAS